MFLCENRIYKVERTPISYLSNRFIVPNGYSDELQIDRIDNEKGYSPDNCRWVTVKENQNNRRSNLIVEYNGERDTVAKLADKYGKNRHLIYQRLKAGWNVKDAFEKEINKSKWSNKRKAKENNG